MSDVQSHRPHRLVAGLAAAAVMIPSAGVLAADVQVTQLDWIGNDGLVAFPFSRVVNLEFEFDPSDPQDGLLLDGAFVNVVSADGAWLVRNLYLLYPDPMVLQNATPSVHVGLAQPNGIPIPEIALDIEITPEPLPFPPPPAEILVVPVTPEPYHAGGFEGGGTGLSIIPDTLGPWIGLDPIVLPVPEQVAFTDFFTAIRPVDEELNGCAPASAARSIQYMGDVNDFDTPTAQAGYEGMKDDMGTTVGPGSSGTSVPDFLSGKDEFVDENNLPIDTRQTFGWTVADVCAAADAIAAGGDVEIMIGWEGGGGHAAMVTGIVKWPDGSATITYVDDPSQGDGMAENEEHVIHVRPDGSFEGGSIIGFQIQTVDPCPTDLDGDGVVGFGDLVSLLAAYGDCPGPGSCEPDLDGDGNVGFSDLVQMLSAWGPCP